MRKPTTPKGWKAFNKRLQRAVDAGTYPVHPIYLCERCGAPLMGTKHMCPQRKITRRPGMYAVEHSGTTEVYEAIDASRISIVLRNGVELRVSLSKGYPAIEVYSTDGRIIIRPDVSNVITVGVEET